MQSVQKSKKGSSSILAFSLAKTTPEYCTCDAEVVILLHTKQRLEAGCEEVLHKDLPSLITDQLRDVDLAL